MSLFPKAQTVCYELNVAALESPLAQVDLADYIDGLKRHLLLPGLVDLVTIDNVRRIRVMYIPEIVDQIAVETWLADHHLAGTLVAE